MKLKHLYLHGHRSVEYLDFEAGQFTVLFGKNDSGKTNILETIYSAFSAKTEHALRRTHADRPSRPIGIAQILLEPELEFDGSALAALHELTLQPVNGKAFLTKTRMVAGSPEQHWDREIGSIDVSDWLAHDALPECDSRLNVLYLDWEFQRIHERVGERLSDMASAASGRPLHPHARDQESSQTLEQTMSALLDQVTEIATDILPDFVDGSIDGHLTGLQSDLMPKVMLEYNQRGLTQCADLIDAAGNGTARWMAASLQVALQLLDSEPKMNKLREFPPRRFSGHVLLIDEPEAHLHPAAVSSVVRWCHRMVYHGFTVIVATHHEEFLRAAGDGVTMVHVTRAADLVSTNARTLPTHSAARLSELAEDIGMHPAAALSINRAILFVEGPLDIAVLDEYSGVELEAAGVKMIPIHGTRNIEGIISAELVTDLGLKVGVLTDATDTSTMAERSGKKRSSEEKKVLRLIELARQKGMPEPASFGVKEEDLLFALPVEGVRDYLQGPFPEWKALVAECRQHHGKSPAESVDWKSWAEETYGLPLTTATGVRHVVRTLDLGGVNMPSIGAVVSEIVAWASGTPADLGGADAESSVVRRDF